MAFKKTEVFEAAPTNIFEKKSDLPEPNGRIDIEWGDGWIKAGNVEDKNWHPVIQKHRDSLKRSLKPWETFICRVIGVEYWKVTTTFSNPKDRFKYYSRMLGCRPTKFVEMWNACNCKAFIPQDMRDTANRFCRGMLGRFDQSKLENMIDRRSVIEQAIKDGQGNIVPFIINWKKHSYNPAIFQSVEMECNISNIRKQMGKAQWKKVLKNSVSRNAKIAHYWSGNQKQDIDDIKKLINLPTGLIPNLLRAIPSEEEKKLLVDLKVVSKPSRHRHILRIVKDTKRMSVRLNQKLPKGYIKWKFSEWEHHHEQLTELINLQKYSKDKFPWMEGLNKTYSSKCGNYTAIILDNKFDIKIGR